MKLLHLSVGLFCFVLAAQQDVIRTTSNEVIVDVVVRDKKGKLVPGLTARDFTILEDGVPQTITAVQEIKGSLTPGAGAKAGNSQNGPADATKRVQLISLVFDRLAIDSRRLARQAANDLIKADLSPEVYIAVFASDLHLKIIQPFTNDRILLKQAIEKVAGGSAMTNYADANAAIKLAIDSSKGGEGAAAAAAAGSQGSGVDGGGMAQDSMNRMMNDMLEFAETSLQEQQGRSSIFSLWAIVKEQSRLPGRKTVLFFSEGLQVPTSLVAQFHSMISSANRANVSVYAIDARGLSTAEDSAASQALLNASLAVSQRQYRSVENTAVTRVEANQFDRAMDSIRSNPQVNLQELAESTGGFLIANMNDFRKPLQRLTEDLGSYYEVIYRPQNTSLDGTFRAIATRLNRNDVTIQSRNGYFALPSLKGTNVLPYEVPLLNALNTTPVPRGLDFRAAVLLGRTNKDGYQSSIVFEMPMKDMTFRLLENEASYRTHVSFLALVKDTQGQVVAKISRDLPINQPKEKLEAFRNGRVIFARTLFLPPGRYTIESAAADLEAKKYAARKTSLIVPNAKPDSLAMSNIALVRRLDDAPANPDIEDPFIVGKKRVIPTLQDNVPAGGNNALSFFFTLYPSAAEDKTTATIEFLSDEKSLGVFPVDLPQPQANGSIPYIATVPLAEFKPALYEVRVRALQGQQRALQTFFVTMD